MTAEGSNMATNKKAKQRIRSQKAPVSLDSQFAEVSAMILSARQKAFRAVDASLVELYWNIGEYISHRVAAAEWGEKTVEGLAKYLENAIPDAKGFNRRGLYRMRQFYETYAENKIVSALRTQLAWTNHRIILSKARTAEEREFYIRLSIKENMPSRVLERQIENGLFERVMTTKPKLSAVLRVLHPGAESTLRDSYSLDFLGLPDSHSEADLRKGIVRSLKNFIIEFGRDFAFVFFPAAIADCTTKLPGKRLLQDKLHESHSERNPRGLFQGKANDYMYSFP
jgi:predicted nuclease of restriction endonuclease-like (RecB) superfamily